MSDYMNDKQLETLKQLGDLGCYTAMDTRLCKLAYDEIMRLRKQVEEITGRNISNQLAIKLLREKVASRDAEIATLRADANEVQAARHVQREHNDLLVKNHKLCEQVEMLRDVILWVKGNVTYSRPMNVRLDKALAATEPAP